MKDPCVIMTGEQLNRSGCLGFEILPGIFIVSYETERRAKEDAGLLNAPFARIDVFDVWGFK